MVAWERVPRDVVPYSEGWRSPRTPLDREERERERQAGRRLAALCEVVLDHHAETGLRSFVTDRLPDPLGGLLVGCALQLADDEDGARAWWRYAAAAEDELSPYCLHLQHQKYGEREAAAWWLARSEVDRWTMRGKLAQGSRHSFGNVTFPGHLLLLAAGVRTEGRPARAALVEALCEYIPAAVVDGHAEHLELDLPLPEPGFADRIRGLLATAAARGRTCPPSGEGSRGRLPRRPRRSPAEA